MILGNDVRFVDFDVYKTLSIMMIPKTRFIAIAKSSKIVGIGITIAKSAAITATERRLSSRNFTKVRFPLFAISPTQYASSVSTF